MIVGQIRYYGKDNLLNQPDNFSNLEGISYNEIRIKAYPGTILTINEEEIHIGEVGVYNILYSENVTISSIKVDEASLEAIDNIKDAYLIITFMANDETTDKEATPTPVTPTPTDNTNEGENGGNPSGEDESSQKNEEKPSDNHDSRKEEDDL